MTKVVHAHNLAKIILGAIAVSVLVLAWGYWHSLNHASLQLRVDDYSQKSERQAYGAPHGVTLTLRDNANFNCEMTVSFGRGFVPGEAGRAGSDRFQEYARYAGRRPRRLHISGREPFQDR